MSFRFGRFRSGIVGAALFQFAVPVPVTKWVSFHNLAFFLWFASKEFGTIGNRFEVAVLATSKVASLSILVAGFSPSEMRFHITSASKRIWSSCHLLCKNTHKSRHHAQTVVAGVMCTSEAVSLKYAASKSSVIKVASLLSG